jgi:hypothetical protein
VLRVVLYIFGACSIFWFFFSFIGVLIGVLYFVLMRDARWRAHGIVLAFCAALGEFVAHTGTAVEPLHLAIRTGPPILAVYLLGWAVAVGAVRFRRWLRGQRGWPAAARASTAKPSLGSLPRWASLLLTGVLVLVPVSLWASVSIDFGVLFDNAPRMLWVHVPSTVDPGEEFPVSVQAWDAYERLSAVYKGTASFAIDSYGPDGRALGASPSAELPGAYTFTGRRRGSDMAYRIREGRAGRRDYGAHTFRARIETPGIHYLIVRDSVTGNAYYSNPIAVGADDARYGLGDGGLRVFWGDLHSHSGLSDGTGSPEHSFEFARGVALLDFYALTDHGEILMLIPGGFTHLERAANQAYEPQAFVTFQGVEWTQVKTGHYTCIFSGEELIQEPRLSYLTVPTTDGLWRALDAFTEKAGCRALALPHHSTQNSYIQDWSYIDPRYVRLAEVSSVHGEFLFEQRHPLNYVGAIDPPPEYVPGSSIADALRMGKRLTLYAASDAHDGHPGHSLSHTPASVGHQRPLTKWHPRIGHPYPGGLTAVQASELTREAVFSALEAGRVFASSDHGRPLLSFRLNGTPVGYAARVRLQATAEGRETPPRRLEIVLAQDGAPAATRATAASAQVHSGWRPDWAARIEIIKNGELLASIPVDRPVGRVEYLDATPVSGASYRRQECTVVDGRFYINRYSDNPVDPDDLNTGGADFYLVRVVGRNGRSAYAGPIWVEAPGRVPAGVAPAQKGNSAARRGGN